MSTHSATCQCGQLTAAFDGDPDFVIVCNCKACQKRTGSPFGTGAYFRKSKSTISGETESWARKADTGRALENHFCPNCGTTLYWSLEMRPDHFGVGYGSFDTSLPDPVRVIWTEQQHPWTGFPEDWPRFEKGTPET
ncbi:MAG: GFA family protein [Paracoccaceae bacterium]|nr:GFA family protein [Paracoccaceae bacterium]